MVHEVVDAHGLRVDHRLQRICRSPTPHFRILDPPGLRSGLPEGRFSTSFLVYLWRSCPETNWVRPLWSPGGSSPAATRAGLQAITPSRANERTHKARFPRKSNAFQTHPHTEFLTPSLTHRSHLYHPHCYTLHQRTQRWRCSTLPHPYDSSANPLRNLQGHY